ncbi:hypothetical protein ACQEVZ_20150 [Dactylosporangium sp. CA-152071]|uniref:hypothetical protein n=1 Tax=Dactylosporangium sp. CA-152071 TaxID=3239933 RepID=UPI003D939389
MSTATLGILLGAVSLLLAAALIALLLSDRDNRQLRDEHAQQTRMHRAELDESRTAYHQMKRHLRRELAHTRGERDLARDSVRELLDAQRAGYRYPRPQSMPMPPDVDDALTEEFTKIVERNVWPEAPSS